MHNAGKGASGVDKILIVLLIVVGVALRQKKKNAPVRPGRAVPPKEAAHAPEQKLQAQPAKSTRPAKSSAPGPQKKASPAAARAPLGAQSVGEGESRECAHGVTGGSISEEHRHEGEALRPRSRQFSGSELQAAAPREAAGTRLSAREMQRAVVMAEILKRPCERERRFVGR